MYKLILDENKTFECDIQIDGANSDTAEVRLLININEYAVFLKGVIKDNKVKIKIPKLKGLLQENAKGNISLEVVADGALLVPWNNEYIATLSKKVQVIVKEEVEISTKTSVKVQLKEDTSETPIQKILSKDEHIDILTKLVNSKGVTLSNIKNKSNVLVEVVSSYFKKIKTKPSDKDIAYIMEAVVYKIPE